MRVWSHTNLKMRCFCLQPKFLKSALYDLWDFSRLLHFISNKLEIIFFTCLNLFRLLYQLAKIQLLVNNWNSFRTILKVRKSEIKVPLDLLRAPLLYCSQTTSCSFLKILINLIGGGSPHSWPGHSQKPLPLKIYGVGIQSIYWGMIYF